MTTGRGPHSALRHLAIEDELAEPGDGHDLATQRQRREHRAVASATAAVGARGLALLASFVAVPLTIGYLGVDRYGIFVAVTSISTMLVFADLGLGNGLLNFVSAAHARGDRNAAVAAVSSAFAMLVLVALVIAVVFSVAYTQVDWASLIGVRSGSAAAEVGPSLLVVVLLFVLALPLGVIERVRMAFQEGFVNSAIAGVAALAGLVALIIAIWLRASLPVLILLVSAAPLIALAANGYVLFWRTRPWLRPRPRLVNASTAIALGRIGFLFLALQAAVVVAFQSDILVAATILGTEAAAVYAVTLKLFLVVPTLLSLYFAALWPAYTEAISRGDAAWVRKTLRRSVMLAGVASATAALALTLWGSGFIRWWTDGAIEPPIALLIGAAVWAILSSVFNAISIVLNAASVILFQVVVAVAMAVASILLSITLAHVIGVAGIIWGTTIAYAIVSGVPILWYLPRFLRGLDRGATLPTGATP